MFMKTIKTLSISILLTAVLFLFISTETNAQKHEVTTGAFINSLYDFNIPEESFKVDMWLWCTYKDSSLKMKEQIEFPYTKQFSFSNDVVEKKGEYEWLSMRAVGEVIKKWDNRNFPFDKQRLNLSLGYSFDTSVFQIIPDTKNSKIDPDFQLPGWNIDKISFESTLKKYQTSFGDPSMKEGNSVYPQFDIIIDISRSSGFLTLMKMITGLLIAFLISCCVFFIKPTNTDPRFGLCVGGLFTAVGNKYITDSIVPSTNSITLIDTLHIITFTYIFLIIIQSVFSLMIFERDTERAIKISKRFDWYSFLFIFISYVIVMGWFIQSALNS